MRSTSVFVVLVSLGGLIVSGHSAAIAWNPAQRNFGHSIKNGHLVANTEITTFEHTCAKAPCTITQMHCPTAGSGGWESAIVRIYVDGETTASITMTLLELANVGKFNPQGNERNNVPWGNKLFGHTAKNGGVYSTMRIPFGKTVKTTLKSAKSGTFWFIVRGIESYPVVLGDLILPPTARLKLYQKANVDLKPFDFITMLDVPKGTAGALLDVKLDSTAPNYTYLEACMRAVIDGADRPLFLSSGAEDYFLSAYYFNENLFKTPNSGLTYYDGKGTLSAYKTHDRDPILFNDGMMLIWRNCERTTGCGNHSFCPNQWCAPGTEAIETRPAIERYNQSETVDATYSTSVWVYEWANKAIEQTKKELLDCPGGALQLCMDACPVPFNAFKACALTCSKRC